MKSLRAGRFCRTALQGVVTLEGMRKILAKIGQKAWCSRVRVCGLLLLIDYVVRKVGLRAKGVKISAQSARTFISRLDGPRPEGAIREPLSVLCRTGVLSIVQAAVCGPHVKASARYAIDRNNFARVITLEVNLPLYLARKRESVLSRIEAGINRKYPFKARLEAVDLKKLSFDSAVRRRIAQLLSSANFGRAARDAVVAVDAGGHWVKINPRGQVTTSITGCPREMKLHLLLDGEAIALCDVACCHHNFLPTLVGDRIAHLRKAHGSLAEVGHYEAELKRLVDFLSDGDYYRKWCVNSEDDDEREEKKFLLTMILNWPNAKCEGNALYRRMRRAFPLTFRICEDIKRNDHRNISKLLQHLTAKAINGALLEAQAKGIVAIPDVDAIICPKRHKETVCALIGQHVYEISHGVCCKVGGVRYELRGVDLVTASAGPPIDKRSQPTGEQIRC